MTYPPYPREKARKLRVERRLTIDQIAERLAVSRTTAFYWVGDLPLARHPTQTPGRRLGNRVMQDKYRRLREEAYADGRRRFAELATDQTFRDFVNLYVGEGSKHSRNVVALCNSDPAVIRLASRWIRHLAANKVVYSLQHHADQDPEALRAFWATQLGIDPWSIRLQRKSNSNQLAGRNWRSVYGVLTVGSADTYLRARLEAWMDCVSDEWPKPADCVEAP